MTPSNEFGVRSILETAAEEPLALYRNADWETRFPRVVCGVTGTTAGGDFGLSTARSRGRLHAAYDRLAAQLGFGAVALAQQVHGRRVRRVRLRLDPAAVARTTDGPAPALRLLGEADGLLCDGPGVLLAVSVADCVPIHVLDPEGEAALLLHAGWRGVASGILESGLSRIVACTDAQIGSLWVHLGPAICGRCYEVGPQVMTSLGRPAERGCVDLRSELTRCRFPFRPGAAAVRGIVSTLTGVARARRVAWPRSLAGARRCPLRLLDRGCRDRIRPLEKARCRSAGPP